MNWIIFNNSNIRQYTDFINNHKNSGIWHYPSWLKFQLDSGRAYEGFFFGIEINGEIIACGLLLIYKSGLKFNYAYMPAGLLYKEINEDIYKFFLDNLKKVSRSKRIIFTQIDSILPYDENYNKIISNLKNHVLNINAPIPAYSTIIDLNNDESVILDNMKPKGRYNIKLASKKEVKIIKAGKNDFKNFFNLLKETSLRDGFKVNSREYYEKMIETLPESELLLAIYENKIIAGGIFTYTKNQGLYYYGASSNEFRNLMAPYLLQWQAILNAKQRSCLYYDFLGISNPDLQDKLSGVTDFKLKFGGKIVKFNSSYHIIHNKIIYRSYQLIKKLLNKV